MGVPCSRKWWQRPPAGDMQELKFTASQHGPRLALRQAEREPARSLYSSRKKGHKQSGTIKMWWLSCNRNFFYCYEFLTNSNCQWPKGLFNTGTRGIKGLSDFCVVENLFPRHSTLLVKIRADTWAPPSPEAGERTPRDRDTTPHRWRLTLWNKQLEANWLPMPEFEQGITQE